MRRWLRGLGQVWVSERISLVLSIHKHSQVHATVYSCFWNLPLGIVLQGTSSSSACGRKVSCIPTNVALTVSSPRVLKQGFDLVADESRIHLRLSSIWFSVWPEFSLDSVPCLRDFICKTGGQVFSGWLVCFLVLQRIEREWRWEGSALKAETLDFWGL